MDLRDEYRPKKFADFLGNKRTIQCLKNSILQGTFSTGTLFHGDPGTGKTALAYVYATGLGCMNFKDDLCGECDPCKFALSNFQEGSFGSGISVWDCTQIGENRLDDLIKHHLNYFSWTKIEKTVHIFDEFHRIRDRSQDKFLKPLEKPRSNLFIFCLIDISDFEMALRQQVTIFRTECPSLEEIIPWLRRICDEKGMAILEPEALIQVAIEADRLPRECLRILHEIRMLQEPLTVSLVKEMSVAKTSSKDNVPRYRILEDPLT